MAQRRSQRSPSRKLSPSRTGTATGTPSPQRTAGANDDDESESEDDEDDRWALVLFARPPRAEAVEKRLGLPLENGREVAA